MTLYELTGAWNELYEMADDPDISPEAWFDTMESIEGEIEDKAENYAKLRRSLEGAKQMVKAEIDKLNSKLTTIDNRISGLDFRMKQGMEAVGKDKLSAGTFTWAIQKNGGKTPLIIAEGTKASDLPEQYITHPDPVINNEAVRKALDEGQELEFAHYGERGTHLRLR